MWHMSSTPSCSRLSPPPLVPGRAPFCWDADHSLIRASLLLINHHPTPSTSPSCDEPAATDREGALEACTQALAFNSHNYLARKLLVDICDGFNPPRHFCAILHVHVLKDALSADHNPGNGLEYSPAALRVWEEVKSRYTALFAPWRYEVDVVDEDGMCVTGVEFRLCTGRVSYDRVSQRLHLVYLTEENCEGDEISEGGGEEGAEVFAIRLLSAEEMEDVDVTNVTEAAAGGNSSEGSESFTRRRYFVDKDVGRRHVTEFNITSLDGT
jgi:hypothetical protein